MIFQSGLSTDHWSNLDQWQYFALYYGTSVKELVQLVWTLVMDSKLQPNILQTKKVTTKYGVIGYNIYKHLYKFSLFEVF